MQFSGLSPQISKLNHLKNLSRTQKTFPSGQQMTIMGIFGALWVFFVQLTWVSDRLRFLASSFLSCPTTYWFFSNACSSFKSWFGENAVRIRLGFRKGSKNSGKLGPAKRTFRKLIFVHTHLMRQQNIGDIRIWTARFNGECFDGVYTKARQLWVFRSMPHSVLVCPAFYQKPE